jgi:hypothetical protein
MKREKIETIYEIRVKNTAVAEGYDDPNLLVKTFRERFPKTKKFKLYKITLFQTREEKLIPIPKIKVAA